MAGSVRAPAGAIKSSNLTGCCGTRTPKWPARRVLYRINPLPRGHDNRMLAVGNPVHRQCPATVQHIQTSGCKRDGRKSYGKQRKHCQEFPHEIRLQRDQHCQEHPHPLPALVLSLHFFLYPPGHFPIELRLLVYFPHLQLLYHLLGCINPQEGSNPTLRTCPI